MLKSIQAQLFTFLLILTMLGQEEATWVPTLEEVDFLKEALNIANAHNEKTKVNKKENQCNSI
jgi:hypothetical protein